jgi:hypothetical protein
MVRIRCESGVRIKILESGFRNPDPHAFAFVLVWFADPDHVRIRNQLHFAFWWVFFMDPDPRIRIQVCVSPNSFRKNFNMIFLKGIRIRAYLWWICSCFYNLALKMRSAFRTVRYVAAFSFALAHQNKAAGWPDPSPVLGSGPSRTGTSHPGIAFARRAMPTMKGSVQEDDYRTEVRLKDKNLFKK